MKKRVGSIIGWICAVLVVFPTLMTAYFELFPPNDPMIAEYNDRLGVGSILVYLATGKIMLTVLYLWPRTSTVGFVLMVGYYGGALATNITHGFAVAEYTVILLILFFLTVSAYFRNPELLSRLLGRPVPVKVGG